MTVKKYSVRIDVLLDEVDEETNAVIRTVALTTIPTYWGDKRKKANRVHKRITKRLLRRL
jgi:hypothetical protein